jgi:hypothetical protein
MLEVFLVQSVDLQEAVLDRGVANHSIDTQELEAEGHSRNLRNDVLKGQSCEEETENDEESHQVGDQVHRVVYL